MVIVNKEIRNKNCKTGQQEVKDRSPRGRTYSNLKYKKKIIVVYAM